MTKEEARKKLLAGLETGGAAGIAGMLREALPPVTQAMAPAAGPGRTGQADEASAGVSSRLNPLADGLAALTREVAGLGGLSRTQAGIVESNTRATVDNTLARSGSGSSWMSAAKNVAPAFGGGGFSLSPLISGLIGLFRGGGPKETADPIQYYVPPPSIAVQAGVTAAGTLAPISYGQLGLPRVTGQAPAANLPPITIQVQTMDSRSFADHSHEIARAVREAMLNGHSLNDVVSEL